MKNLTLLGLLAVSSAAFAVDFDFESEPDSITAGSKTFSSGGLDMTASVAGGYVHVSTTTGSPIGNKALAGANDTTLTVGGFLPVSYTFSQDITAATFWFRDGGGDPDGTVSLDLYDAGNSYITTLTAAAGDGSVAGSILINQTFRTAVFSSDGPSYNLNSLYQEWSDVDAVPEPVSLVVLSAGALLALRRKKRAA